MWKTITTTNYATATDYAGINFFPGFTLTWEKRGKPLRPLIMQLPPILQTIIFFQVLLDLGETLSIGGFLTLNHSPRLRRRYLKSIIINYGDVMVSATIFWDVPCGRKREWAILLRGELPPAWRKGIGRARQQFWGFCFHGFKKEWVAW